MSKVRRIGRNKWLMSAVTLLTVVEVAGAPIKWGYFG